MSGAASGDLEIADQITHGSSRTLNIQTAMSSLDEDILRLSLPDPEFIKIDIEGMEIEGLKGMSRAIDRAAPDLYLELHGVNALDKQKNASEVIAFLLSRQYEIFDVERECIVTRLRATRATSSVVTQSTANVAEILSAVYLVMYIL
jgi:hypothetical protein